MAAAAAASSVARAPSNRRLIGQKPAVSYQSFVCSFFPFSCHSSVRENVTSCYDTFRCYLQSKAILCRRSKKNFF